MCPTAPEVSSTILYIYYVLNIVFINEKLKLK